MEQVKGQRVATVLNRTCRVPSVGRRRTAQTSLSPFAAMRQKKRSGGASEWKGKVWFSRRGGLKKSVRVSGKGHRGTPSGLRRSRLEPKWLPLSLCFCFASLHFSIPSEFPRLCFSCSLSARMLASGSHDPALHIAPPWTCSRRHLHLRLFS